jgi:hypothetical protein
LVFAIRHQRGGICTDWLFADPPTREQYAQGVRALETKHGTGWTRLVEIPLLTTEMPPMPETPNTSGANSALTGEVFITAVGHVQNPGE